MLPTRLRGARTHNLRAVDVDIRPGEVTVLTGPSGSGKSSLALDTLYAEGQRRFVESFSPYARQFLERLQRPPMDELEPVAAGVAVDRSAPVKSSRSTVATMADLEPYLAGLFATESTPHCPEHGEPAVEMTIGLATSVVLARFKGRRISVTAPQLVGDRVEYLAVRDQLVREGYRRVLMGDKVVDLDELKPSVAEKAGRLYVLLDRFAAVESEQARLKESLEIAFARSKGLLTPGHAYVFAEGESEPLHLRQGLSCPTCARGFLPPRPGYFSYESPLGACDNCRGFGRILGIDAEKVIPNDALSLKEGAIRPWRGDSTAWERKQLAHYCEQQGIPMDVPWARLPAAAKKKIWEGKGGRGSERYWGISEWFGWLEGKAYKMHVRVLLSRYRSYDPCPVCEGTRLNESSRYYRLGGLDLGQWHTLEIEAATAKLSALQLSSGHGQMLGSELSTRLEYLRKVGLGYLTLDRPARTLSGGESQRVTLTAALGTSLHSALFVLDEPTVGLHPEDVLPLGELIRELALRNNAVIVIEHDPSLIALGDRVVELGPGAGDQGGRLVFDGTPALARKENGATARALAGPRIAARPSGEPTGQLRLVGVTAHNLKGVTVSIPLGQIVAVCGPSGSGKSSLVVDVLYPALARQLKVADAPRPGAHEALEGAEDVRSVELVDQSPLGRTSRGNPATYTKAWDVIRKAFAAEPEAAGLGYSASHFSFNVAGGRCEACSGEGYETVEMQFLADVSLVCPVCQGRRFKEEILAVRHRGLSIFDALELSVDAALKVFEDSKAVRRALAPLSTLGLGYVRLGQPLSTLSGGEAQRLKLARALADPRPGTMYLLDEPSAGLHADEVELLLSALSVLKRAGGSIVLVDHDLPLLLAADHLIELGPGGGTRGGNLVFEGPPAGVASADTPTGRAVRASLKAGAEPGDSGLSGRGSVPSGARKLAKAELTVTGARQHTLKDVAVTIPHNRMTVVTGPSGSGKSTLAFDVVFAEGQRRFLETLTPYARRFLPTLPRPNVDSVVGVPPSVALEQRTSRLGARSTVATVTEVAHYLRLLFAKVGVPVCPNHGVPITSLAAEEVLAIAQREAGSGALLAPVVRGRKGTYLDVFNAASRAGLTHAIADGRRVLVDSPPRLAKSREHDIDLVVSEGVAFRLLDLDTLRLGLRWGRGNVALARGEERIALSVGGACPSCGFSVGEIDPRYFSFNTKQGQCPTCEGTGLEPEPKRVGRRKASAKKTGASKQIASKQIASKQIASKQGASKDSAKAAAEFVPGPCSACGGQRLAPFSRKVTIFGRSYPSLVGLSVRELSEEVAKLRFDGRARSLAEPILPELERRLRFLREVGLDYLTLDRDAGTLSGGEIQRLRLAAQLGAGLTGALYVLDEPTIGLHPRDTARLIENLRRLVDTGSTVLLVEHDEEVIRAADHLIDLGPRGGSDGGQVMSTGRPELVLVDPASPTGQALSAPHPAPPRRALAKDHPTLELEGARVHNLVGDVLSLPHGRMTVVCGVSGSGKSTLVRAVLLPALLAHLGRSTEPAGAFRRLSGTDGLERAVSVDQSPIGRTPRSVPATFLGIFDQLRRLFALSNDAKVRGFSATRFSFNTQAGGRCVVCEGQGVQSHEMSFLPDVVTTCPACEGLRFDERTLEVRYLGLNIGEVLRLSASDACRVFAAHPKITRPLAVLDELGAGYVTLGQGSHTLSGGEAQRLKLAAELAAGQNHEPTLYVLDEPTTGLHVSDVGRLIGVLTKLTLRGDTLVVIEHHPEVIAAADWVVELGPEGGPGGGHIVFSGLPSLLAKQKTATGLVLARR